MLARFDLKFVKESRIAQISGNMLIASSRAIEGVMKSQAMLRSDRPRTRLTMRSGVRAATRSTKVSAWFRAVMAIPSGRAVSPAPTAGETIMAGGLELAFV